MINKKWRYRGLFVLLCCVAISVAWLFSRSVNQSGIYNIEDYGAKANDAQFDNAPVFNKIIEKIGPQGGVIYIPVGDYYLQSSIEVDRSYITIKGDNSGLRSGVDKSNALTQEGGGGSRLIPASGVTAIKIANPHVHDRISGVTFRSFQIKGENNNGIGIHGAHDTDRVVVDDLVLNHVGIGIQLTGADAALIRGSWIAETKTGIILDGASQQANISQNALGAQPSGVTLLLENAKNFNIHGNNIFPDGSSAIRLLNPMQGNISGNTITSYYTGVIELLGNDKGDFGNGNVISGNVIRMDKYLLSPEKKSLDWGLVHIEANTTLMNGNHIMLDGAPAGATGILIKSGEQNHILSNHIVSATSSQNLITLSAQSNQTRVVDSVTNEQLVDDGKDNQVRFFSESTTIESK